MQSVKAIVYTSNAGHTRAYAELLSKRTGLPAYDLASAGRSLSRGAAVIYLGWIMAGQIRGYKKAAGLYDVRALCGVGMAAGDNLPAEMKKTNAVPEELPLFILQGGFDMEKLHGIYRLMMKLMKKSFGKQLAQKKDPTPSEKDTLALLTHGGDRVSEERLDGVMEWFNDGDNTKTQA